MLPETITALRPVYPRSQLQFIASRTNVFTPFEEIERDIRERATRSQNPLWTDHRIHRCSQYVKAYMNDHIRLMRSVGI
jgi:hypothetical protein